MNDRDLQLWTEFLAGDKDALGFLAARHYRTLLHYGNKFGVDQFVVEDCIQDLFLELWQNRKRIRATPSVKFYLLKSLRNNIFQYMRYQKRFPQMEEKMWETSFPDHVTIESSLIENEVVREQIKQLQLQMESLPKREREALYLRYYENMTVAEISEIMLVNPQSVSNFLQKALRKIRHKWIAVILPFLFFIK